MTIDYTDELDAGWIIFPLHRIERTQSGVRCGCGDDDCQAIGKHPRASNWQHTQPYEQDQLDYLEDFDDEFFGNQLIDNHGVVVASSGLIIVDVDGRNGGFDSAAKLAHIREQARYIVRTGSGNGEHWYFTIPAEWVGKSLSGTLRDYPGIDFKSTGFVVGAGCEHASGQRYEAILGSPAEASEAPADLMDLLNRPERARFVMNGTTTDYSTDDLRSMVEAIPNRAKDYERWIRVGMALHDATGGSGEGFDMWHEWSAKCPDHDPSFMDKKWHSFGKSALRATVGTLIEWARESGWSAPVTFTDNTDWDEVPAAPVAAPKYDLLRPPGLVGQICQWINSRCAHPREQLAVAAALQIVSNAAGLNYLVAGRNTSLNLMSFAIAGSRSGKGPIKACINEANRALGLSPAEHGKFKSSQELVRNAIQHQIIIYTYDEFGEQLKKVSGAARSGAHYLEDLTAELIAMYSVATGVHNVSGDVKREIVERMDKQLSAAIKKEGLEDGESPADFAKAHPDSAVAKALADRSRAEYGIVEPYLTFFGMSEPTSFHEAIGANRSLLTGGFLGRSLIFEELETVPEEKDPSEVYHGPMPDGVMMRLMALSGAGSADARKGERIERQGDWQYIDWSPEAEKMLRGVRQYWRDVALHERDTGSGLESQALGATELAIKVAGILGAGAGTISSQDIGWAHELIKRITHMKINKAKSGDSMESADAGEKGNGLLLGIMTALENAGGEMTPGVLKQRVPGGKKVGDVGIQKALDYLVERGRISCDKRKGGNGRIFSYYSIV
ncbi:MAG: putative primase [Prokaryotic dsDNA virus sp.]|jgi:hypothetical protein|nr:hypothetical protein [Pseudomonadales bacterium]QDP67430.1 MAG: putative primase [Prokaryotic dsDNA virus sp.]|tara:strand:+ start:29813 stop:32170 length:2358 start_codon:yes stop_codon:yes gene_type:complete